jgi:F-type H+-transporting ATPase subunit epsilon
MAMTVRVDIVSIEKSIFSGMVEFVVAPAEMGEVGIYPGHAPLISRLKSGAVRMRIPEKEDMETIYVSGGMLEVQPGSVTILSDLALPEDEMSEDRLAEEGRKVSETMKNRSTSIDYVQIEAELARAFNALRGYLHLGHKRTGL